MSSDAYIEDLKISALPLAETAKLICRQAGSGAAESVFTMNLDHVVKMRKDAAFREVYGRAGLITADGFPIVLACRLQGKRIKLRQNYCDPLDLVKCTAPRILPDFALSSGGTHGCYHFRVLVHRS